MEKIFNYDNETLYKYLKELKEEDLDILLKYKNKKLNTIINKIKNEMLILNISFIEYETIKNISIENYPKILMKNDPPKYTKNIKKFNEWIENIKKSSNPDELIIFAKFLRDKIRYVSFNEFNNKINELSVNYVNYINKNKKKYDYIVFTSYSDHGSTTIDKSDFWVLLLSIYCINKHKFESNIIYIPNIDTDIVNKLLSKFNILITIFDDMAYSGTQLNHRLFKINNSIIKNIDIEYICDIYLFVPYISTTALNKFEEQQNIKNNIIISKSTEIIESLVDQFKEWYGNKENYMDILKIGCPKDYESKIKKTFNCNSNYIQIPIYFEHKIADFMSTFNTILLFGTYPVINDDDCNPQSLINDCDENISSILPYNKDNIINCDNMNDNDGNIYFKKGNFCYKRTIVKNENQICNNMYEEDMKCPSSFYKTIQYTQNNKNISNYEDIYPNFLF